VPILFIFLDFPNPEDFTSFLFLMKLKEMVETGFQNILFKCTSLTLDQGLNNSHMHVLLYLIYF